MGGDTTNPADDTAGRNEDRRLKRLADFGILDSAPEQRFDDIAKIAAQICGTPIALISLVDRDRQWIKAHVGTDLSETARSDAFCANAIGQDGVFEVPDAADDETFASNPLVTGAEQVRFYAGAPLATPEGNHLGTLCVLDRQPRELTDA